MPADPWEAGVAPAFAFAVVVLLWHLLLRGFQFYSRTLNYQVKIPGIENFFSRLQIAVGKRGLSLPELSGVTGIALSTMYRWKDSAPHSRTSRQIAEKLRVSEKWLREGEGEMEANANTLREGPAQYKFTSRVPPSEPTEAAELHAGCLAMLKTMTHLSTPQALDYAVLTFEETWQQFKEAKYNELNQVPP